MNDTEQNPSCESDTTQHIKKLSILGYSLWNLKICHRVHSNSQMQRILNQQNPVHNIKFVSFKNHLNNILQTNLGPANDFFSVSNKKCP